MFFVLFVLFVCLFVIHRQTETDEQMYGRADKTKTERQRRTETHNYTKKGKSLLYAAKKSAPEKKIVQGRPPL